MLGEGDASLYSFEGRERTAQNHAEHDVASSWCVGLCVVEYRVCAC